MYETPHQKRIEQIEENLRLLYEALSENECGKAFWSVKQRKRFLEETIKTNELILICLKNELPIRLVRETRRFPVISHSERASAFLAMAN